MDYGVLYPARSPVSHNYSIKEIILWHEQSFPDTTIEEQRNKFKEELKEWEASLDMLELADMVVVACGMARYPTFDSAIAFHKISDICMLYHIMSSEVMRAVDIKMAINKNRKWKKSYGVGYKHI